MEANFGHRKEEVDPKRHEQCASDDDREVQTDRRQADPDKDSNEACDLRNL
jgi:hypothetical protein